jgi:hypothetical protein
MISCMGLGERTSDDDVDSWRVGQLPSRREVIALAIAILVVSSVVYVVRNYEVPFDGDFCGTVPTTIISLEPVGTETRQVSDQVVYDAWFVCTDVFAAREVPWTSLTFWINDGEGLSFGGSFVPVPEGVGSSLHPMGYYRELAGEPKMLDVGDQLCLANLNRTCQGEFFSLIDPSHSFIDQHVIPECDVPCSIDLEFINASIPRKGSMLWDATFSVRSVRPEGEHIPWSFIRTRELYNRYGSPDRYEFYDLYPLGSLGEHRPPHITGYFNDSGLVDGVVDVGDTIVITGNLSRFLGTDDAALYTGNVTVAELMVPTLPDPTVRFHFSEPTLTSRVISTNETLWDCEFVIEGIEPEQGYLEWGNPRVEFPSTDPDLDVPWWANSDKGTYPESAQVFFREVEPVDGRVDVGDAIVIKSMSVAFEGRMLVMKGPGTTIRLTMPAFIEA